MPNREKTQCPKGTAGFLKASTQFTATLRISVPCRFLEILSFCHFQVYFKYAFRKKNQKVRRTAVQLKKITAEEKRDLKNYFCRYFFLNCVTGLNVWVCFKEMIL